MCSKCTVDRKKNKKNECLTRLGTYLLAVDNVRIVGRIFWLRRQPCRQSIRYTKLIIFLVWQICCQFTSNYTVVFETYFNSNSEYVWKKIPCGITYTWLKSTNWATKLFCWCKSRCVMLNQRQLDWLSNHFVASKYFIKSNGKFFWWTKIHGV